MQVTSQKVTKARRGDEFRRGQLQLLVIGFAQRLPATHSPSPLGFDSGIVDTTALLTSPV